MELPEVWLLMEGDGRRRRPEMGAATRGDDIQAMTENEHKQLVDDFIVGLEQYAAEQRGAEGRGVPIEEKDEPK